MKYKDLRDFISQLERAGELKRISQPVSTALEMTEISDRVLKAEGPALLFENATHNGLQHKVSYEMANLFEVTEASFAALGKFDKMLVDPPRECRWCCPNRERQRSCHPR